jgi:hypothetical protein
VRARRREIEAEVLEEIGFHLDLATRESVDAGMDPAAARAEAERRFGSVNEVLRGCVRAQMGEAIMLQKMNFVLVALLLAAVTFVGVILVQVRDETAALRAALAAPGLASPGLAAPASAAVPPPEQVRGPTVSLLGSVRRPGLYPYDPRRPLTLTKLIAQAGDFGQFATQSQIQITRRDQAGTPTFIDVDFGDILAGDRPDVRLEDGDLVYVPESVF